MDKQQQPHHQAAKPNNKIFKFLPKAASAVHLSFQNPPFSPGRDKRLSEIHQHIHRVKPHVGKGFSGPIISIIPDEVRRRTTKNGSFENQEPTSPKISCMGQIKHKKKIINNNNKSNNNQETKLDKASTSAIITTPRHNEIKKHALTIKRLFTNVAKVSEHGRRKSDASIYDKPPLTDTSHRAPTLGHMKRFASGRDTFANFDWTSQVTMAESDHRNYNSDGEEDDHGDQEDGHQVHIPFAAPIIVGPIVGNLQPRKEINLWQRRTMNPPKPLQLSVVLRPT